MPSPNKQRAQQRDIRLRLTTMAFPSNLLSQVNEQKTFTTNKPSPFQLQIVSGQNQPCQRDRGFQSAREPAQTRASDAVGRNIEIFQRRVPLHSIAQVFEPFTANGVVVKLENFQRPRLSLNSK